MPNPTTQTDSDGQDKKAPHMVLSWSKFFLLCRLVLAGLALIYAAEVVMVFRHQEWHAHFVNLFAWAWRQFVANDVGSTTRGFVSEILSGFLVLACASLFVFAVHGIKAMREHVGETAAMAMVGLATVLLLVYGTQFAWEVAEVGFRDHADLAQRVATLSKANTSMVDPASRDATITDLRKQLEVRKQMLVDGDPAFDNMRRVLQAFAQYRNMAKGQKCYVWITSPTPSPIITEMSELSTAASNCFTFSTSLGTDSDLDAEIKDGMRPGVIMVHARRGDVAANEVEATLSGIFPMERSYKTLSTSFPHYQGQTPDDIVLWLQFGPGVRWSSDQSLER